MARLGFQTGVPTRQQKGRPMLSVRARLAAAAIALLGAGPLVVAVTPAAPAAAQATSYAAISGSGSAWAAVALEQWAENLRSRGIVVNYNPDGSAAGRADYIAGQVDFAASDVAFRTSDPFDIGGDEHPRWGYSYIPDVAGGTAFMYHLSVHGHLIRNLRLSGPVIMKIFTGKITNWDSPEITRSYGKQLPSIRIIPVIHSEGSGDSYFLSSWMAHVFPAQWNAFCARVSHGQVKPPCGPTEFYPARWGAAVSRDGSANVASYISSSRGQGAIGYLEYSYARSAHWPVAKIRNPDGRYVLPTPGNVTIALRRAEINENPRSSQFLQQDLNQVYADRNPRSYPLSSYSYLIVPRTGKRVPPQFSRADGRTLSVYVDYLLCGGQRQSAGLGYAPLPVNLVRAGLQQVSRIPGHVRHVPPFASCR
jgi:ABC-type phosphate transport system substrate-binding protein